MVVTVTAFKTDDEVNDLLNIIQPSSLFEVCLDKLVKAGYVVGRRWYGWSCWSWSCLWLHMPILPTPLKTYITKQIQFWKVHNIGSIKIEGLGVLLSTRIESIHETLRQSHNVPKLPHNVMRCPKTVLSVSRLPYNAQRLSCSVQRLPHSIPYDWSMYPFRTDRPKQNETTVFVCNIHASQCFCIS